MKKKRKQKKNRLSQEKRRNTRKIMGKPVFFTLTKCSRKLSGISNRLIYKANMHTVIFKGSSFYNIRYQTSIITKCNFNETELIGVDFCNTNLKQTSFKNAYLESVCFMNCNLKNVDFLNAKLHNVVFICTGISDAKNLVLNETCTFYNTYPKLSLDSETQNSLIGLSDELSIYQPRVIHVSPQKLNNWSIKILLDLYGVDVFRALLAIRNKEIKNRFFTIYSYKKHIENYLKI